MKDYDNKHWSKADGGFGWIGAMLRHDSDLNQREEAPTGDDYNAVVPVDMGFIWGICGDPAEFLEYAAEITKHSGVIQSVTARPDGIDVVFAISRHHYAQMVGREPDAEEWLDFSGCWDDEPEEKS